jgi:crotonobetainyl-CoA:carnitine CoA-transferase CaiB-like acyl-CoA transferase
MFDNSDVASSILTEVFLERTLEEWTKVLAAFSGQWAPVQDVTHVLNDPQARANDYLPTCHTGAGRPFTLVSAPVQFDGEAAPARRAPEFNEHGDSILAELGISWDDVVDLKVRGIVG